MEKVRPLHTPGPWRCDWNVVEDAGGTTVAVARVTFGVQHQDIAIGNAQLISAAPEMFAALLSIERTLAKSQLACRDQYDMLAIARVAIHKTVMGGK